MDDAAENQSSPAAEEDPWEDELEWTGFTDSGVPQTSEDDTDPMNEPIQPVTKPTGHAKLKPKPRKPLLVRDLVKMQIRKDNQSNALEPKKRKLTEDDDWCILFICESSNTDYRVGRQPKNLPRDQQPILIVTF